MAAVDDALKAALMAAGDKPPGDSPAPVPIRSAEAGPDTIYSMEMQLPALYIDILAKPSPDTYMCCSPSRLRLRRCRGPAPAGRGAGADSPQ